MHRLLYAKNVSRNNLKWLSNTNGWNICYSCGNLLEPSRSIALTCTRIFATTLNTDVSSAFTKPKKRKWQKQKYAELIQENESSLTEKKTAVKKLTSKNLTNFVDNSDESRDNTKVGIDVRAKIYDKYSIIDLEPSIFGKEEITEETPLLFVGKNSFELTNPTHNLQQIIKSYEIFKEINCNEEQKYIIEDSEFVHTAAKSQIIDEVDHPEKEKTKLKKNVRKKKRAIALTQEKETKAYNSKYYNNIEEEHSAKHQSLSINLASFVEQCVETNAINRAFQYLQHYRLEYKQYKQNISVCNLVLGGFAEIGNFHQISELLDILKTDNIACDAQSYSAIFECLGRLNQSEENRKLLRKFKTLAEEDNITLNDIIDHSKFTKNKREIVINAIRRIDPHFTPVYTPPELKYKNCLLDSLNRDIHPIEGTDLPKNGCDILNDKRNFSLEQFQKMTKEQLEIELKGVVKIKSIANMNKDLDADVLVCRQKIEDLRKQWLAAICVGFNRDLNNLHIKLHCKRSRSLNIYPYLRVLPADKYAEILLDETQMLSEGSETYSHPIGFLHRQIGRRVMERYHMDRKARNGVLDKTNEIYEQYYKTICDGHSSDNSRQMWQRLVHKNRLTGASMDIIDNPWPLHILTELGRFLYEILLRDVTIDINIMRPNNTKQCHLPAFYTIFRIESKVIREEVKPHPVLARIYRASQPEMLTMDVNSIPMLCPPQPWSTPHNGGYILARSELIRLPAQAFQQWERINISDATSMYPALDALNQLASVAWKVNTKVLDVILEVFNNNGSKELDVAQPPSALPPLKFEKAENDPTLAAKEKFEMFRAKLSHKRRQGEMYSLWCDTLYRLSLANHYRDKVFWLPHNLDFRGRVYPVPPHLNHLGSDLARSLLVFYKTKPLGENGFTWLKLHCINLTGHKKRDSIQDRLMYAEEMMDNILDSADNPLNGRMWWTKSDEPWQTLTTCMEIANAIRSPNPAEYLSSFPIHQDGSCNGLQHYAALGRDVAGAKSVNLCPSKVPQDVYSDVAYLVEKLRKIDEENGDEIACKLKGFVQRKVIKQTVMTTVYGVTQYGAKHQIAKQLKAIDSFPSEFVWKASNYLTKKTFESLHEMFTATKEIQDWLTNCAQLISAIGGQNVEWITPLGLPVVQPYSQDKRKSSAPTSSVKTDLAKPNVLKQKNAFPPNFIHSLDSTHMMLTSLHCERAGFTFMSVHDCYWTHACTVADMNKICREQFVALHNQPILEDLSKYLVEKYSYNDSDFQNDGTNLNISKHLVKKYTNNDENPQEQGTNSEVMKRNLNRVIRQVPRRGQLDLKNVLDSVYFFS